MLPVDPDELDVRPVGKALVHLQLRTEPQQLLAHGVAADDRVRVADGDRGQLDPLVLQLDRLGLPHLDVADAHRDRPVAAKGRGVRPSRRRAIVT